jgi:hypothetical protein
MAIECRAHLVTLSPISSRVATLRVCSLAFVAVTVSPFVVGQKLPSPGAGPPERR